MDENIAIHKLHNVPDVFQISLIYFKLSLYTIWFLMIGVNISNPQTAVAKICPEIINFQASLKVSSQQYQVYTYSCYFVLICLIAYNYSAIPDSVYWADWNLHGFQWIWSLPRFHFTIFIPKGHFAAYLVGWLYKIIPSIYSDWNKKAHIDLLFVSTSGLLLLC